MGMTGWKTWAGAAITALSAFITGLGYPEIGDLVLKLGLALLAVGIGHKIEKSTKA